MIFKMLYTKIYIFCLARFFKFKNFVINLFGTAYLDYKDKEIKIVISNLRELQTRSKSCSKEPETIHWIESNSNEGDIFFDIGANIGAYSLVAAYNKMKVYAFEPSFQNFYRLNQNVSLNLYDDVIHCLPIGLSSSNSLSKFNYLEVEMGTSRNFFNESNRFHLEYENKPLEKSTLIMKIDEFISRFKVPVPTMIKIDVDGAEFDILKGAQNLLSNKNLKTILIEIDIIFFEENEIISYLNNFSFKLISKHTRDERTINYIFTKLND